MAYCSPSPGAVCPEPAVVLEPNASGTWAERFTTDVTARIVTTMETMIAVTITDAFEVMRLAEFAADVLALADERVDPELRELIDRLHADLLELRSEG